MPAQDDLAKIAFGFSVMLKRYKDEILGDDFQKLTIHQYFYLRAIGNMDDPTPGALAEALKLSRPTVTIALGKLEKLGFLTKERSDKDARFTRLVLTEKGEKISKADYAAYDTFLAKLREKLTEEESEMLIAIMGKLADSALESIGGEDREVGKLWLQRK